MKTKRWFTLRRVESDSSRLSYEEGVGTVLTVSAERTFEFQIHECDDAGHRGLCGQWADTDEGYANALLFFLDCLTTYRLLPA